MYEMKKYCLQDTLTTLHLPAYALRYIAEFRYARLQSACR